MTAPEPSVGPPPWRVAVAFAVVALLAVGLIVVSRSGTDPTSSPIAAGSERSGTGPIASSVPPTPAPNPTRVLADTARALAAWGVFAATGELDEVTATFAEGPQLEQLRAEAPDRLTLGPGLPAFRFTMSGSEVVDVDAGVAVVRTSVTMTRPGTDPADFRWQIEMRWDEERNSWMLYTVATPDEE